MRPFTSSLLPDWRTFVSAALIVLSFPPWDFRHLIWIALVPWFVALARAPSTKQAFIQGIWLSFFMSVGGFFWVAYVLHQFGGLPWPLAILGLLLYGLGGQPQFLLVAPAFRILGVYSARAGLAVALLATLAYTGIDWVLPKLFVDTLGHSLYSAEWLRQIADLGGATLLTWLVVFVNDTIYRVWVAFRNRNEPSLWPVLQKVGPQLALAVGALAASSLYGAARLETIRAITDAAPQRTAGAVIQANIGDFDKVAAEKGVRGAANAVINTHIAMSEQALAMTPRPEFLVWPETAYPSTFRTPSTADELARDLKVTSFVRYNKIPLFFGGYDSRNDKDYNAFFLLSPEDGVLNSQDEGVSSQSDLQVYHKNILLLFGEYIPGAEQFQFLKKAFPQVGNFGRGPGPEVLTLRTASGPQIKVGPVICYEVLFPSFVIGAVRKGSQLVLNVTNDSWFGPWGEPQLHLALSTFRSVETRIPTLRATNTGITSLILPDGTITHPSRIGVAEVVPAMIPILPPVWTLMLAWGDWFGPAAFVLGWIGLLAIGFRLRSTGV